MRRYRSLADWDDAERSAAGDGNLEARGQRSRCREVRGVTQRLADLKDDSDEKSMGAPQGKSEGDVAVHVVKEDA